MFIRMLAAGMVTLFASMRGMTLSRLRVMRARLRLVFLVKLRSLTMIFSRFFVMIGSIGVMLRRGMFTGHLRFSVWILALQRASL
jgi:hypothetical protein